MKYEARGNNSIYRHSRENEELRHKERERGWETGEKAQGVAENQEDKPSTLITIGLTRPKKTGEHWRKPDGAEPGMYC
jgi:hypothetical protein